MNEQKTKMLIWGYQRIVPSNSVPPPQILLPILVDKIVLGAFYFPLCAAFVFLCLNVFMWIVR